MGDPATWSLDPIGHTGGPRVHRSTFEAMHLASVARLAEEKGATAIVFPDMDPPFVYILDGPHGPVDLGAPLPRVDSLDDAIEQARRCQGEDSARSENQRIANDIPNDLCRLERF